MAEHTSKSGAISSVQRAATTFQSTTESAEKDASNQIERSLTQLGQSKDHGQTVCTSSLTISLVVILKELVDQGYVKHQYHVVNLVLVSVSIALQIFSGFLVLTMLLYQRTISGLKKDPKEKSGNQATRNQTDSNDTGDIATTTSTAPKTTASDNAAFHEEAQSAIGSPDNTGGATPYDMELRQVPPSTSSVNNQGHPPNGATVLCTNCCRRSTRETPETSSNFKNDSLDQLEEFLEGKCASLMLEIQQAQAALYGGNPDDAELQTTIGNKAEHVSVIQNQLQSFMKRTRLRQKIALLKKMARLQTMLVYVQYATLILHVFIACFGIGS